MNSASSADDLSLSIEALIESNSLDAIIKVLEKLQQQQNLYENEAIVDNEQVLNLEKELLSMLSKPSNVITVHGVKCLINYLTRRKNGLPLPLKWIAIRSLRQIMESGGDTPFDYTLSPHIPKRHPNSTCYFNWGISRIGVMKLPPIDWKEFRGYTFSVWIWLPKLTEQEMHTEYEGGFDPSAVGADGGLGVGKEKKDGGGDKGNKKAKVTLLSLSTRSGSGVSIKTSLGGRKILIRTRGDNGDYGRFQCDLGEDSNGVKINTFKTERWHLLSVTHSSAIFQTSKAIIYLNGMKVQEQALYYPSISEPLIDNFIGGNFAGRMNQITLYNDVITDNGMQQLFSRGPDHSSLIASLPVSLPSNARPLITSNISNKLNVIFRYDASNADDDRVFESRPEGSTTSNGTRVEWVRRTPDANQYQRAAALSDGLFVVHGLKLMNMIHALGGAVLLLSLLKINDVKMEGSSSKPISKNNSRVQSPTNKSGTLKSTTFTTAKNNYKNEYMPKYIAEVLSLLCDALRRSPTFQEDFYQNEGYKVVNGLLRQLDVSFLTKEVLACLISLVQASQVIRGRTERLLYTSAIQDSLFDFFMWRLLPLDLLSYVCNCCYEIIQWETSFIRDHVVDIPALMLSIYTITYFSDNDGLSEPASLIEIENSCKYLVSCARIMVKKPKKIMPHQVGFVFETLCAINNLEIRKDLVIFLTDCMDINLSVFLEEMKKARGSEILLQLLQIYIVDCKVSKESEDAATFSLDDVMSENSIHKKAACDEEFVFHILRILLVYLDSNVDSGFWNETHVTWLLGNIGNFLKKESEFMSRRVILLLIGCCVGELNAQTENLDGSQALKHPQVLVLVWLLLPFTSPLVLEHAMLQSSILLKADEDQQLLILQQEGWQRTLLPLSRSNEGMGNALARDLLTLLMCQAMEQTDGYSNWLICVSCSLKLTMYSIVDAIQILKVVAESVLGRIARERLTLTKDLISNLTNLILFCEIFIVDENGLMIGLDPSLSENQKLLSPSGYIKTLQLYSKNSFSLVTRIIDLLEYFMSNSKLEVPMCTNMLRILVCNLIYMDMEMIQRCIQIIMQYIQKAPPSYLNDKHLTFFVLFGVEAAIESKPKLNPLVINSLISLYISLTDTLPDTVRSLYGKDVNRKGSVNENEYKRRSVFLLDLQTEAAAAFASSRQETMSFVCSQPVVSPISSPQIELTLLLADESNEVTGRPAEKNENSSSELFANDFVPELIISQKRDWSEFQEEHEKVMERSIASYMSTLKITSSTEVRDVNVNESMGDSAISFAIGEQEDTHRTRRILKRLNKKKVHLSHQEAGTIFKKADDERKKKKLAIKIEDFITLVDVSKEEGKKEESKEKDKRKGGEEDKGKHKDGELEEGAEEEEKEDDADAIAAKLDIGGQAAEENALLTINCKMYIPQGNLPGTLKITKHYLFFSPDEYKAEDNTNKTSTEIMLDEELLPLRINYTYSISGIQAIYCRRHRLQDTAIEIFFDHSTYRENVFYNFEDDARNKVINILFSVAPTKAIRQWPTSTLTSFLRDSGLMEAWIERRISNFEYLMALNTIAGRTFNDLSQYPVFPWVIKDYTSETIDISNVSIYRDLSKPIGALNPERLEMFKERYETFADPSIPKFLYGSHYSNAVGTVLFFLIRLEPFTSLHCAYQDGHFDVSDRLFQSVPHCWNHSYNSLAEVKELIPEWYYLPEMFKNVNSFNFGKTQDGTQIHDVILPPWASDPEDFVRINREALESEYVSAHIHDWIDLIFGYKQRGPAAVAADNVFYYLTYFGAVDLKKIEDESLKEAIFLQIDSFGQTPMQVLTSPHPPRRPHVSIPRTLLSAMQRLDVTYHFSGDSAPYGWINRKSWIIACTGVSTKAELATANLLLSKKDSDFEGWKARGTAPWNITIDFGTEVVLSKVRIQSGSEENAIQTFAFQILRHNMEGENVIGEESWVTVANGNGRKVTEIQQFGGFHATSRLWRLHITKVWTDNTPPFLKYIDFFGITEDQTPCDVWSPALASTVFGVSTIKALQVTPTSIYTVNELGIVDVFRWAVGLRPERPSAISPLRKDKNLSATSSTALSTDAPPTPLSTPSLVSPPPPINVKQKRGSILGMKDYKGPALIGKARKLVPVDPTTPCILLHEGVALDNVPRVPPPPPIALLSNGRPLIFSANPHDGNLEVRVIDTDKGGQIIGSFSLEADYDISSMAIHQDLLITGSTMGITYVWQLLKIDSRFSKPAIINRPLAILRGLSHSVVAVDICKDTNMAVTSDGSSDVLVHSLGGEWSPYFIKDTSDATIVKVCAKYILIHKKVKYLKGKLVREDSVASSERSKTSVGGLEDGSDDERDTENKFSLKLFNVNCKYISEIETNHQFNVIIFSKDSSVIFGGGSDGCVYALSSRTLKELAVFECKKAIHSLCLNESEEVIVVGCEEGQVYLFSLPNVRYDYHNTGFISHVARKARNVIEDNARNIGNQGKGVAISALNVAGEAVGGIASGLKKIGLGGLFGRK